MCTQESYYCTLSPLVCRSLGCIRMLVFCSFVKKYFLSDGGMSMEEATSRQNELEEDHKRASNHVEELQEKLQQHKDRLQRLRDRKFKLSTELLNVRQLYEY